MMIVVHPADLLSDREIIVQTLLRYLTQQSDQRRFEWLYTASPQGQARAWLATDGDSDSVIGAAAAFPRYFYSGNDEMLGWVLGDFCLDPQYRSLGPALQLQRACVGLVEENQGFCYDFPSASMAAVYRRMGLRMTGQILRLAMPLRVNREVKKWIKATVVQHMISSVGNAFLKITLPNETPDKTLEISIQERSCGEEFTALMHEQRGKIEICLQRSAEYLNWRYVNNPLTSYEIITARRHGNLKGYAVWTAAGEDASVVDLFGENNPVIVKALLADVVARLRNRGVATLSLWLSESHPWFSWCSELGFQVRGAAPFVCVPAHSSTKAFDVSSAKWFLMHGDRDS